MFIIELLCSALSVFKAWKTGDKWKYAPIIGLVAQVLWIIVVIEAAQWGLLPGVIIYTFIYIRNAIKWINDDKEKPNESN